MNEKGLDVRDAFFDELYKIASKDRDVIFLTADMSAFSLQRFKKDLPDQYCNIGISEQNMISLAAGLALSGKKVFVYAIAPFATERCYEQVKIDLCAMKLPVTIIGMGPGITYSSDGPTHHATEDISIMRALPEMNIISPCDAKSAAVAAEIAYKGTRPVYVRLDKGKFPDLYGDRTNLSEGLALLKPGRSALLVTTGIMTHKAFLLAKKALEHSIDLGILDIYMIKPFNRELFLSFAEETERIITLEEHSVIGGIGSIIAEVMADSGINKPLKRIGIEDTYSIQYGDREWMHSRYGLDIETVMNKISSWAIETPDGNTKNEHIYELTLKEIAFSFGAQVSELPAECEAVFSESDFRYKKLDAFERNKALLNIIKRIDSGAMKISGKDRQNDWESGWSENLKNFVERGYDLNELIPGYYNSSFNKEIVRFNHEYISPCNKAFEVNWFSIFRIWLYSKYLGEIKSIYEFGCGTGHNLILMAKLFPEKSLYGLDWAVSSQILLDKVAEIYKLNIKSRNSDMFSPDLEMELAEDSAILTIGSMEQLGSNYQPFLSFVLAKSPKLCIHVEPILELYNEDDFLDYLAIKYHKARGYLNGYLPALRKMAAESKVNILRAERVYFGSQYQEGYSYIIWKPNREEGKN